MNIYDFDGTIYDGDSSIDFYKYNLRKKPSLCLLWPVQALAFIKYKLHIITKTQMKEVFYRYFSKIDAQKEAELFWSTRTDKFFPWFFERHTEDDVLVSASPEFFLKYPCEKLGIDKLIASVVDPDTGKYTGENCHGEEKLRRFLEAYPEADVECSYFDKMSDLPVSNLARHRYLVYNYGALAELADDEHRDN